MNKENKENQTKFLIFETLSHKNAMKKGTQGKIKRKISQKLAIFPQFWALQMAILAISENLDLATLGIFQWLPHIYKLWALFERKLHILEFYYFCLRSTNFALLTFSSISTFFLDTLIRQRDCIFWKFSFLSFLSSIVTFLHRYWPLPYR